MEKRSEPAEEGERSRLRAILIEDCGNLERAIHYAYDVGKRMLGVEVTVVYHVETPYGHVFLVGNKKLYKEKRR